MSMKRRNSARVRASLRNTPVMRLVTIDTPRLCTPRVVMHSCTADDHHAHAARLEHLGDAVGDLRGELLLHLKAPRVAVHDARELADAHHLVGRQVADVHAPDDRRHVVLAVRLEGDVAQHDQLIVAADLLEGAAQVGGRVDVVAGEPVAVGVHHALRGVLQPLAARILARPAQAACAPPLPRHDVKPGTERSPCCSPPTTRPGRGRRRLVAPV